MAIKILYQLQADEENWTRWPDLIEHYQVVQAKSFSISLKGWKKILTRSRLWVLVFTRHFLTLIFASLKSFIQELNGTIYFLS